MGGRDYEFYRETKNGELKRNEMDNVAIKFLVVTTGRGSKISIDNIVMIIALFGALLRIAYTIVDSIMLYLSPSKTFSLSYPIQTALSTACRSSK